MDFTTLIEELFKDRESATARDLKLNLKKLVEGGALDSVEAHLVLLATATSVDFPALAEYARGSLLIAELTREQVDEAAESAAMMAMLNIYYRFRHMVSHNDPVAAEAYKSAGLRMTALAKPALGKARFEMLALAVSVLNGCETCISAHEKTLREQGIATEKIHDLARLAAVVKAVEVLTRIK